MFLDRREAGERLAKQVMHLKEHDPVVLALPRGGVVIGAEVARMLQAPLDLLLVRKIGAPTQPELAVGAVIDGEGIEFVVNEDVLELLDLPIEYVRQRAKQEVAEIERRRRLYLGSRRRAHVRGHTVLVVDGGIATGATMRVALRGLHRRGPARLVLAVPVAPADTIESLRPEVDEIVCLEMPHSFGAIGAFYDDFRQVSDEEVCELLHEVGPEREEQTTAGAK